jgi:hypothetical protein
MAVAVASPVTAGRVGPVVVGALGAVTCAYTAVADPSRPGSHFVPCPLHALTGWRCPGCGMTRAVHDVLTGHPGAAFGQNLLWPLVLGVLVWAWLSWAVPAVRGPGRVPAPVWGGFVVVALVYGVARNVAG